MLQTGTERDIWINKMPPIPKLLAVCFLWVLHQGATYADNSIAPEQSFRSCSLITSELLTSLQFRESGLTLDQLKDSLPTQTPNALKRIQQVYDLVEENGAEHAYRSINDTYQQCALEVYEKRGKPPRQSPEFGFYFCSGENKLRYQVLEAHLQQRSEEQILNITPAARHSMAREYLAMIRQDGTLPAFQRAASELKQCINQIMGLPSN